jgi:hypothetical protein
VVDASLGHLLSELDRVLPLASHLALRKRCNGYLEVQFLRCKSPDLIPEKQPELIIQAVKEVINLTQ